MKGYFEMREIERGSILNKKKQDGECFNKTYELDIYKNSNFPYLQFFSSNYFLTAIISVMIF